LHRHWRVAIAARRDRGGQSLSPLGSITCRRRRNTIALDELAKCCQRSAVVPPQQRWRRAAPHGGTECHCRRVAIKRDEHAPHRECSAVALPSRAGGGQCNMAASGAAAGAPRSHETSTPRVVHDLPSSSPAALAECSIALQHRVPLPARRDRARRARPVSSALRILPPQPSWRRAVPHGCVRCRNLRFAVARDKNATCRLRSAGALQALSPAALAKCNAARKLRRLPPARRYHARQARQVLSALCKNTPQQSWRKAATSATADASRSREASTPCVFRGG
jgi:hypothetical protein